MQTKVKDADTAYSDREKDEELADVLTAISVVSKRLASRLLQLDESKAEEKSTLLSESEVKV